MSLVHHMKNLTEQQLHVLYNEANDYLKTADANDSKITVQHLIAYYMEMNRYINKINTFVYAKQSPIHTIKEIFSGLRALSKEFDSEVENIKMYTSKFLDKKENDNVV